MRYPHSITILRPRAVDEYGNAATSWDDPEQISARGFMAGPVLLVPPSVDIRRGDRVQALGGTYDVEGDPEPARSPGRHVLTVVSVQLRRS